MNKIIFWIFLLGHFIVLAPHGIHGIGNRGNCSYLQDVTLKFVCYGFVTQEIYLLYRDQRAPVNSPYSVWKSEDESIILVSFHDNYLHRFTTMNVVNSNPEDRYHTFSMHSAKRSKEITIRPSILICFPLSLRYPMELLSICLGKGRSSDVASRPVLHYAMQDYVNSNASSIAHILSPCRALVILVVFVCGKHLIYV